MRRLLAGAAIVFVASALALTPAAAHTETGEFSATRAEPNSAGGYTIDLLLTYTNDGHGAVDADLTVTAQGPSGGPIPVPMTAGDREGAYTGVVELTEPGTYTISASSPEPEAATTFTVEVPEATTTTEAAPTTTESPDSSSATAVASAPDGEDDESSEGAPWWTVLIFAGVGAVIGVAFVRWRNARKAGEAPDATP